MLNKLNKKIKGAAAFEWVLLSPLMIITVILLLYFFLMTISYIQYNNLANTLAQDLNMRQSGFENTQNTTKPVFNFKNASKIVYNENDSFDERLKTFINGTKAIPPQTVVNIRTNSTDKVLKAAYYSINKHKEGFYLPGAVCTDIQINATRNGLPASNFSNSSMSGTVINVLITYKSFGFTFKAKGYNIIT